MTATGPHDALALASQALEQGLETDAGLRDAIAACRAAIELLPSPTFARLMLARLLAAAGDAEDSVRAYQEALAEDPANSEAWAGLAHARLAAGDPEGALAAAASAVQLDKASPDAWHATGQALLRLAQPVAARDAFSLGARLAPGEARMQIGLGDAAAELDDERQALGHFTRAAALDPGSKWAQAHLGAMQLRLGDLPAAERHCLAALALDPALPGPHRNLAGVYADQGDTARSRHHLQQAFAGRNVVVDAGPAGAPRVLALTAAGSGNTPYKYLLPRSAFTRIDWFIEFADAGQAAPPHDIVFNLVGDPDYAAPTEAATAAFLAGCTSPVLNLPSRIAETRRDRLPNLLADIKGAWTPRTIRLASPDGQRALTPPILIRPMGSHGGAGLSLARTPAEAAALGLEGEAYATTFVDFASPADGLYRKYRVIFIDRAPLPYHLAIKDHWLVHYATAGMGDARRQAEELRFLDDPMGALGAAAWGALEAIGRRLDLDYAGIDFSVLPDGRVLVFEANATMLVHPEPPDGPFAYKNPFVERITQAFGAMIRKRISGGR